MSAATQVQAGGGRPSALLSIGTLLLRYSGLIIVDAIALFLFYALSADGVWELSITIAVITIFVNYINLRPGLDPLRWISPALALMGLMVIFPLIYTVYVSFTNYGDGHLLTKQQALDVYAQRTYLPEGGATYEWTPYLNDAGEYALWLEPEDGGAPLFGIQGQPLITPDNLGETNEDGLPLEFRGYELQSDRAARFQALGPLEGVEFGRGEEIVGIADRNTAGEYRQRYVYDASRDVVEDRQTGDVYVANDTEGVFENEAGEDLITGYRVLIGFENYERFLTSPAISGPLLQIFLWTIAFALISVFSTFALGLFIALMLQGDLPFRTIIRTLLIVPYALPALISVATWKGMLNPNLGVLTAIMEDLFGAAPPFFSDPTWAKFGILLINLWLGYPYFMLVCSGALSAIPKDMYEAARVDGANVWEQFTNLTLPLLLVAVGPLLIASFTYNFNNFVIIEAYNEGGPPIPGTPTPAGYTDILISYAFRLAFGSGRGTDFGLASAITLIIFIMVAAVTLMQFRFTRQWEETSENV